MILPSTQIELAFSDNGEAVSVQTALKKYISHREITFVRDTGIVFTFSDGSEVLKTSQLLKSRYGFNKKPQQYCVKNVFMDFGTVSMDDTGELFRIDFTDDNLSLVLDMFNKQIVFIDDGDTRVIDVPELDEDVSTVTIMIMLETTEDGSKKFCVRITDVGYRTTLLLHPKRHN